jgi:3D (Asp-Asp-Asp) domain-containing protein
MKPCIAATGLALLFVPHASARPRVTPEQRDQSLLARVTVYWASGGQGSDSNTRRHQCSTGVRLRVGHCAVDPRRIPYGSKVVLGDGVFTAVDTGGAVISRKAARRAGRTPAERNAPVVDRFFETKRQALSWANAHPAFMTVQVIPPNYSRAGTALRPQLAKQAAPQPARQPAPQFARHSVPQLVRQSTPQLSKQPAPKIVKSTPHSKRPASKVATGTVSQAKRIAGANPSKTPDQAQDVSVESDQAFANSSVPCLINDFF